jgi:hypothetical protein
VNRRTARIAGFIAGRSTAALLWLLPLLWLVGGIAARASGEDAVTAALVLHLPAFASIAAAIAIALVSWPPFARQRPGADWVLRLCPRRWRGCGAAMLGAVVAAGVALASTGLLAPWLLPTLPAPHAFTALHCSESVPVATPGGPALHFAAPAGPLLELRLRPLALAPQGLPQPTSLTIRIDGTPAAPPIEVGGSHQLWRLPLAGAAVHEVALQCADGTVTLAFPPGAVEVVAAAAHSASLNAALALLLQLVPCGLALALACAGAPWLTLPVSLAVAGAAVLLCTLGQLAPTNEAVRAALQGRWLPAEPVFLASLPALAVAVLAMVSALASSRWVGR